MIAETQAESQSPLAKYRVLFADSLEDLLREQLTITIQTVTQDYAKRHYDVNEAVGELRRRLVDKLVVPRDRNAVGDDQAESKEGATEANSTEI